MESQSGSSSKRSEPELTDKEIWQIAESARRFWFASTRPQAQIELDTVIERAIREALTREKRLRKRARGK